MKRTYEHVYQFKIALKGIEPTVWRQIQVPETYSFWDLHVAIQDSMGWLDYHLHEFELIDPSTGEQVSIGIPSDDFEDFDKIVLPGWELKIADYFAATNVSANYEYDFGDGWQHEITFEQIILRAKKGTYPTCIAGERACPPEDCGGVVGYQEFLEIIMNPAHERYKDMLTWAGGEFHPEYFNPEKVKFTDPAERLKAVVE